MVQITTGSVIAKRPLEMLLVSSSSSDPNSTLIVEPRTGVASWSYKGSELQGVAAGFVEPIGPDGTHFVITTKDRPLVHLIGVHNKDRFHQKSVLNGPVTAICSDSYGKFLFVAVGKQIFAWLLTSGELLSVTDAHYQNITNLAITDDDSLLVSTSQDGSVNVYIVSQLIAVNREGNFAPIRKWTTHTLAVKSLYLTKGTNPRIVTVGLDHIASVYSLSMDAVILKISTDRPLTSCVMDHAESRLFLGTDVGNIAQVDLYSLDSQRDILVQTADEHNTKFRVLNGHSEEITKMTMNADGSILASGDASGRYCIWDISSRQCLKVASMRASINTLRFVPYWPVIGSQEVDLKKMVRPNFPLHRDVTKGSKISIEVSATNDKDREEWNARLEEHLQLALERLISPSTPQNQVVVEPKEEKVKLETATNGTANNEEMEVDEAPFVSRTGRKKKRKGNKAREVDSDIEIIEPEPFRLKLATDSQNEGCSNGISSLTSSSSSSEVNQLKKQLSEALEEVGKLKRINKQIFEFTANEIIRNPQ